MRVAKVEEDTLNRIVSVQLPYQVIDSVDVRRFFITESHSLVRAVALDQGQQRQLPGGYVDKVILDRPAILPW